MKEVIKFAIDGVIAVAIVKGIQMYGKHQYEKGYDDCDYDWKEVMWEEKFHK